MTKLALNCYLLGDIWQLSELRKCMGLPIGITVGLMLYKSHTTWYEKVGVLNERIIIRRKTCFCSAVLIIVLPRHPLTAVWDKNRGWGEERAGCSELSGISRSKWNRFNYYEDGRKRPILGRKLVITRAEWQYSTSASPQNHNGKQGYS